MSSTPPPDVDAAPDVESPPESEGHDVDEREPCPRCELGVCQQHCGALRRQGPPGGRCFNRAGFGTNHVGIGHCKFHGGSTPSQVQQAQRELASRSVITFGLPREVDPQQALLEEVHRTAGHVAWCQAKIASLESDAELKQLDQSERFEKPAVWVEMYQEERKHLTRVSEAAIRCGIAERQVKLAEAQGAQLAGVLRGVLDAVFAALVAAALPADVLGRIQREQVPAIVRQHLSEVVEGGPMAIEADHTQTPVDP